MTLKLTLELWRKGRWYIARCPELDFVSQRETPEKARQNLHELIQIQLKKWVLWVRWKTISGNAAIGETMAPSSRRWK